MFAGLTALAVSTTGAGLILYSWRHRNTAWAAFTGWLVAFASAFVWSWALGPELGATYAIIVFVCLVWAEIGFTAETGKYAVESSRRPWQQLYRPVMQDYCKHLILFLLSVPASGVITMMLSVALVLYLPWTMPVKFAVAILLYPVLWGALSAWIGAQVKLVKPLLVTTALLVVSSLLLFI